MNPRTAEIVGGPRDGEIVPFAGVEFYEPIRKPFRLHEPPWNRLPTPAESSYEIRRYRAYRWFGQDGVVWRYVADEYAKGLGCP